MARSRSRGPYAGGTSAASGAVLQNVSGRFTFREEIRGRVRYKEISGELGIPGQVITHRDRKAQEDVSAGTGEHAGHLIAIEFGAPGDIRNLGLQNPNMNTYAPKKHQQALLGSGGSYRQLEIRWKELLLQGWRVHVTVTDKYRLGENRSFTRHVRWTERSRSGEMYTQSLDFGNFGSQQMRDSNSIR